MTLSRGVELPLADEVSVRGVDDPDKAGVPAVGRLFDIMPVVVRWKLSGVADESVSSWIFVSQAYPA